MKWRIGGGRKPIPKAPQNVRIVRTNGEEIPIEVRYDGKRKGMHRWVNAYPIAMSLGDDVRMDMLPGHTEVEIRAATQ